MKFHSSPGIVKIVCVPENMIILEYFQMSAFIHLQVIELNKEKNSIKLVCADFT